jgi:hypothetical protein
MKTLVCAMLMLGCAIVTAGCAEQTKKPVNKGTTGNASGANGSAAPTIDSAKKEAGEAIEKAGETASKEMKKAGETASKAVEEAGDTASKAVEKAGESAKGAMEALGSEFSAAAAKAKTALNDVQGGPEILQKITDLFASAQQSLRDLKDSKAAEAATAKLAELDGKIDEVSQSIKPLPESAKSAIASVIEKGIEQIKALVEKARELPDIAEEVKAKLSAFVEKLGTLKG